MKRYFRLFMDTYFRQELDFRARLFTVLALSGIVISLLTMLQSLFTGMHVTTLVSAGMIILSACIMRYARKSGNYRRCYYITTFVIFLLFFPMLFFVSGGYHSGMPAVFIFAALFTTLMLNGWQAFAMVGLEIFVYTGTCLICYLHPELVIPYPTEEAVLADILFTYSAIALVCGIVIFLHLREYDHQRELLKEKNHQLRQMDEAKTTFLTTVAHEVKNPLNIISLHAQDSAELLEEVPPDLAQLRENQRVIEETVLRIDRVLTDLMDTVSIEQGRLTLSRAPMHMAEMIRTAAAPWLRQYETGKSKTALVLQLDDTLPPLVADYTRLCQVLENLLANAFRHTRAGTVTITLTGTPAEQTVCVADNGEGMEESMRKKALEGYVSADKNYWRHGIGLYVCHRVVDAHGGTIRIESAPGSGTKIFFTLPVKEDAP